MIVVLPNANWNDTSILTPSAPRAQGGAPPSAQPAGQRGAAPAAATGANYGVAEQEIVNGIIPYIEGNYRALPGRENRTIAGLSMGGGISINVGLKRLDVFATVAQFSSGCSGTGRPPARARGGAYRPSTSTRSRLVPQGRGGRNKKLKLL
jgi:predicted alpha/beta superfamily hydrolase